MTPPIARWSTSPRANLLPPTIVALLRAASNAARANRPLRYHKLGFYDPRRVNVLDVHSFATARAAERRGLVQTSGEAPFRILHITGLGLDAQARLNRKARP
jgi:hypothetical protein